MKPVFYFLFVIAFFMASCQPKFKRTNGGIQYQEQHINEDIKPLKTIKLPHQLEEISGLSIYGNNYLGFNDSGGEPEIYVISEDGNIIKTIILEDVKNVDFESITSNKTHIFIGDFGNNKGDRKNLRIHYFEKSMLNDLPKQAVNVETLKFYFPEQTDFSNQNRNHDFDCEAMFYHNGQLHLFTKEWKSFKTKHYTINIQKGKQAAKLIETFDANFLVTGADAITENNITTMGLIGYTIEGEINLLLQQIDAKDKKFFRKAPKRIILGTSLQLGQVEGIALKSQNEFCISAERFGFDDDIVFEHISCYNLKSN